MSNQTAVMIRPASGLAAPAYDVVPAGYEPIEINAPRRLPTREEFEIMRIIASTATSAGEGMVPKNIKTPEAALMVMLAGFEIGMPPITALRRIFPVNGKTELETQAMIGLVKDYDPTARFLVHEYSDDACDVELFRQGESVMRVRYTDADRTAARQGMQAKKDFSHGKVHGPKGDYWPNAKDANGQPIYEDADDSPWTRFRRDMLAYNAFKRCCRLGAPEAINQISSIHRSRQAPAWRLESPEQIAGGDNPALANPLSKALAAGDVNAAALVEEASDATAVPTPEPEPDPPAPPSGTRRQQSARNTAQAARAPVAPPVPAQAPSGDPGSPAPEALLDRIRRQLGLAKKEMTTKDYTLLYTETRDIFQRNARALDLTKLTLGQATECLRHLQMARGEMPDEETPAMTNEREPLPEDEAHEPPPAPEPAPEPEPAAGDPEGDEEDDDGDDDKEGDDA